MKSVDGTSAQVTLSGRELALMRRQAMALHGKAAASPAGSKGSAGKATPRAAMAVSRPAADSVALMEVGSWQSAVSADSVVPTAAPSAARLRRQAMSQQGKAALPAKAMASQSRPARVKPVLPDAATCGCGCNRAGACATTGASESSTLRLSDPAATVATAAFSATAASSGIRGLARARRQAMATDGKAGLRRVAQATRLATAFPDQAWQQAIDKGATARQMSIQHRMVASLVGRDTSSATTPRPSGRMRARNETAPAPEKVALGHTLSGRPVSGTAVDSTRKVTGNEAGNCHSVTGTEYLGLEQFETLCGKRPAPGPAKVGVSTTARDQKVTGTEVGRSAHVTGDEVGACRGITGTEYLAREHFDAACDPAAAPAVPATARKVTVMPPAAPRGTESVARVTGTETGSARKVTGSSSARKPVLAVTQFSKAPTKVAEIHTAAGSTVTGTEVGRSPLVTGDHRGGCLPVTGTEYIGPGQQEAVCAEVIPVVRPLKVGEDHTWRGQTITGSHVGRSSRVTGDEPGGCAPISGTPYIGRGQYKAFCAAPEVATFESRIRTEAVISAALVTGDRPGAGGHAMTGDERGACGPVSGTRYIGRDNAPACPPSSGRYVQRSRAVDEAPASAAPRDFSIRPPARQAQERAAQPITGTAFSSQRITGPVNKAGGLITGTPEFRHHEVAPSQAAQAEPMSSAAMRLTGEGSQAGTRISGDAWQSSGRVTGTEGTSSLARNPSQRGPSRAMGMNALQFRDVERAAPAESRITGSSGSTVKGAAVTLSGGARG